MSYSKNAVLEYDPVFETWTAKNPMPNIRVDFDTAVYQNKIYVIGGLEGLNQVYDPATDTWEDRAPMPTPIVQIEANVVDGKIYLIGGGSGLNQVYDPANDSWTTKAPMPIGVTLYASAAVDNKIYFIGGTSASDQNINQIYDADTDTWSFGAPTPTPVSSAQACATSGLLAPKRIYVIGGRDLSRRDLSSNDGVSLNQVYNPQNDSWTTGAPMPTGRFQFHMTVLNDQLYAMGGLPTFGIGVYCLENEQYTPIGYGTPTPSPQTPQPQPPEPFPITTIVAIGLPTAIVVLAVLLYAKKRAKR